MEKKKLIDEIIGEVAKSVLDIDYSDENYASIYIIKRVFDNVNLREIEEIAKKHNLKLSFYVEPKSRHFLGIMLEFRRG